MLQKITRCCSVFNDMFSGWLKVAWLSPIEICHQFKFGLCTRDLGWRLELPIFLTKSLCTGETLLLLHYTLEGIEKISMPSEEKPMHYQKVNFSCPKRVETKEISLIIFKNYSLCVGAMDLLLVL